MTVKIQLVIILPRLRILEVSIKIILQTYSTFFNYHQIPKLQKRKINAGKRVMTEERKRRKMMKMNTTIKIKQEI